MFFGKVINNQSIPEPIDFAPLIISLIVETMSVVWLQSEKLVVPPTRVVVLADGVRFSGFVAYLSTRGDALGEGIPQAHQLR